MNTNQTLEALNTERAQLLEAYVNFKITTVKFLTELIRINKLANKNSST